MTYAKALALVHSLPLIAVNHIEGHIHSVASQNPVEFPALALVVSGGHTHLYEVAENFVYRLLGRLAMTQRARLSTRSRNSSASVTRADP
jgi:N6-L-threonylcarbamoyladenine synthase